jgi:hypothetical protein
VINFNTLWCVIMNRGDLWQIVVKYADFVLYVAYFGGSPLWRQLK